MPDTEENVWGHFLLSNFWSHRKIGCSLQKAVKVRAHTHTHTRTQMHTRIHTHTSIKAIIIFQYGVFFLHPKADFIQVVTITKKTQLLRHQQEFSQVFMLEFLDTDVSSS